MHQFKAYNYMPTTHAHELLHSMQSAVTARYGEGSQFERRVKVSDPKNSAVTFTPLSMAAVYLGQGKLAFVPTPENISLRQLADFLPPSLRVEPYFKSYISQPALLDTSAGQLFSFAQPTSHLIDEFSCRHLGAEMALGLAEATVRFNQGNVNGKSFFDPGIEPLILFSLALGVLAAQKGAVFSRAGDREQFFAAIRFLVERSAWLNAEIAKSPDMRPILRPDFEAGHVLRIFLRAPDCAEFRGRVKEVFGPEMYELLSLDPRGELLARGAHFQELGAELLASAGGM
jgi:hypothetical protein